MNTIYNTISFDSSTSSTQMRLDRARNSKLIKHGNRVLKTASVGQIEREYDMLKKAAAAGINVPHVVLIDEHTLSLQFIPNGQTLFDYMDHGKLTKGLLAKVKSELKKFWKAGFVHADLHLNNILINEETQEVYIIDLASSWDLETLEEVYGKESDNEAEVKRGIEMDVEAFKSSFKKIQAELA